jgi:hypothetical protein
MLQRAQRPDGLPDLPFLATRELNVQSFVAPSSRRDFYSVEKSQQSPARRRHHEKNRLLP